MYVVYASSLNEEVALLKSVDNQIGKVLQLKSGPALLPFTEALLFAIEKEISARDAELDKNIQIIHSLYQSYRYRFGGFLITPIETVALKLSMKIGRKKAPSTFSHTAIEKQAD